MELDPDMIVLYKLIAKHGSDWVKKRICPKEAAQFALKAVDDITPPQEDDGEPQ